jgi:exoribonuclease R
MRVVDKVRANSAPGFLRDETRRCIQHWKNTSGEYCTADSNTGHDVMNIGAYTHITSPIRRLVDLLNQMVFLEEAGLIDTLSNDAREFRTQWTSNLDGINTAMRSIRKVQTDCDILALCVQSPHILESTHHGVVFDRVDNGDGSYSYMVFLEDIRLLSRFRYSGEEPWDNYSTREFNIHLFHDEHTLNRKVRVSPHRTE